ncbi:MAG: hypothetical protein IT273_03420 [Chitinophagales bacterium]|nr:hypothetical protein [Chitinophagales bacterium]
MPNPIHTLAKYIPFSLQNIFLFDACGALLSAGCLGFIGACLSHFFGLPRPLWQGLAAIACVLAIYSLVCYIVPIKHRTTALRIIITANVLYACLNTYLISIYYHHLTLWGLGYLILEVLALFVVVVVEMAVLHKNTVSWKGGN